jgi:pyruvate dehydrogenase E2 component (dihydrolipoamide acetyltransferase)
MDVVMPQLGETVAEGTVMVWYKKIGERVEADELLFEVGTDKVETEIPAVASGVLAEILVAEGETVDVGTRLAIIDDGNLATEEPTPDSKKGKVAKTKSVALASAGHTETSAPRDKSLSPVVRKLLGEHGIDASEIDGSGDGGRITRRDVMFHVETRGRGVSQTVPAGKGTQVVPFSRHRKLTAEHMVRSKSTSAHVLQAVEVDFHRVDEVRDAKQDEWQAREGFALTYLPFISKAVCQAMADFPHLNAHVDGDSLVVHENIHLAIAVDLNFEGLVTPVIRDANSKTTTELARDINGLAERARARKLAPDDLSGATYTISNSGSFGTLITAPIISQPQVAILSIDGVTKKPVVITGAKGDDVGVRPIGILAQSFDHRAVDGAYSAAFLRRVKEILESEDWLAELT